MVQLEGVEWEADEACPASVRAHRVEPARPRNHQTVTTPETPTGLLRDSGKYTLKGVLCEVPFFGGSVLLLFYSVVAMAACNYIP